MKRVCWYNLPLSRDERGIIFSKLEFYDFLLARIAHNSTYHPTFGWDFSYYCAQNGYLKLLQWSNVALDNHTSIYAATKGHLHIIKWARSLDPPIPWNVDMCWHALYYEQYEILRWCIDNGIPVDDQITNYMNEKGLLV